METLLHFFILIPLAGFIVTLLVPAKKESLISWFTYGVIGTHVVFTHLFIIAWWIKGAPQLNVKDIVLYRTEGYEYFIDFFFDRITATYLFVGSALTFLVAVYSRYYLHRENGYKRFFNTMHFFYLGYNVVIFSGNMETLFIGWEMLGISSFLLIAFYRDRYLPVKNAMKVFSIYRLGDVGIITAMWLSHHLWHENITFVKLNNYELVHSHLETHSLVGIFISLMILVSAAAKSAQLPFSSWLPRAMEGPTPSSAIFYGSLSVHLGVFLLMRTYPFWEHQTSVRILIAVLGLLTSVIATLIARVQSSAKSQIAYASVSQIGIIFIELAAGLEVLALVHFAGNAFMRTYQLLVSPSVVTYLIREQFYNFQPRKETFEDLWPKKIEYTLYILSIKEWNLDSFLYRFLWTPMKWIGKRVAYGRINSFLGVSVPLLLLIFGAFLYYNSSLLTIQHIIPTLVAGLGLLMVLRSFIERQSAFLSWILVIMNHFYLVLAVAMNETVQYDQALLYLGGVMASGVLGVWCLRKMSLLHLNIDLTRFHGHSEKYPVTAFVFLTAALGLAGFPITPTFIGEDLIFSHIHEDQFALAVLSSLSFIIDGLAIIRIYARLFMGPNQPFFSKSL
jgi:NADH-quinone oxidoreductase subunit L